MKESVLFWKVAALLVILGSSAACSDSGEEDTSTTAAAAAVAVPSPSPSPSPSALAVAGQATVKSTECNAYVVTTQNSSGEVLSVVDATVVSVTTARAGAFYVDSSCATATGSVTLAAKTSSNSVYFKDAVAESLTLTFSATGLTPATKTVAVTAADASVFALTSSATSVSTGVCSGPYTLKTYDASSNAASVSSAKTATLSAGSGSFYLDSACVTSSSTLTLAGGTGSGTFYFSTPSIATLTLTADDGDGGYTAASITVTSASSREIAAGGQFTCALTSTNTVKCWGNNAYGQLGLGDLLNRGDSANQMGSSLPAVSLGTGRTATALASGGTHACAILDNATLKCWGRNNVGQLGQGDALNRGDSAGQMGDNLPVVSLGTGRTVRAVAASAGNTCAILDNFATKCFGNGANGQLGSGATTVIGDEATEKGDLIPTVFLGTGRSAREIRAGNGFVCARLDDNTLKCWGKSTGAGELGLGDGAARGDGASEMGDMLPTVDLGTGRTARNFSLGLSHACSVLDDATVKCWGSDPKGELGQGDTNSRGGSANQMGGNLATVNLGTGRTARAISTGISTSCAILDNATVKCWGENASGQLGQGDAGVRGDGASEMGDSLPTVALGTSRTAQAISVGDNHFCVLLDNLTVRCWGQNTTGALGLGDIATRSDDAAEVGDNIPVVSF